MTYIYCVYIYIDTFKGMMILLITSGTFWSTFIGFRYGVSLMITGGPEHYQWLSLKVLHALSSFWERSHLRQRWRDGVWLLCSLFCFEYVMSYDMISYGMIWLMPINHYDCDKKVIMTMIPLIMMGSMTLPPQCCFVLLATYDIAFDLHLWSWLTR